MSKLQIISLSFGSTIAVNIVWAYPAFLFLGAYLSWGWLVHKAVDKNIYMRNHIWAHGLAWLMPVVIMFCEWENFKEVLEENFGGAKKYFPTIRNPFVWGENNLDKNN